VLIDNCKLYAEGTCTIYANYEGHGIELIACKNVLIDNCKLYAEGT
jgi:hypothetical protein